MKTTRTPSPAKPLTGQPDGRTQTPGERRGAGLLSIGRRFGRSTSVGHPASRRRDIGEAIAFVVVIVVGLAVALNGTTYTVQVGIDVATFVTLAYSWNIISGFTGYISFGQVAFYGIGAFTAAELMLHAGVTWYFAAPLAGVLSGLLAVPLGMIMLRLRGIYFALGMYGLVAVLTLIASRWNFTGGGTGLVIPGINAQDQVFLYTMGVVVIAFGMNAYMTRSRFGLRAMSVRDDEEAAAAMGVATVRVKVTAYALSAILPAVVGALVAYNRSFIDSTSMFDPTIDLQTILYAIAGGMGTLWGPLIGAVVLQLIGEQLWLNYPNIELALFGGLIILILLFLPGGVVSLFNRMGLLRRVIVKAPVRLPELAEVQAPAGGSAAATPIGAAPIATGTPPVPDGASAELVAAPDGSNGAPAGADDQVLTAHEVGVNFGGVQALRGIDMTVRRGETVCIIGANGAGKTTFFNAVTGLVSPSSGSIMFNGRDVSKTATHVLAANGLGRTFQIPRPFESMTVWENIFLAALGGRRSKDAGAQAAWVVHLLNLEKIWLAPVNTLPVGYRRMVELGRALALQPDVILLDEVMAGMSREELEQVRDAIRKMPSFGVGAVAGVEHVVHAIVDLADRIVVLDEGRKIAEGVPDEIMRHPEVVKAYLGEEMLHEAGPDTAAPAPAAGGAPVLKLEGVDAGYGGLRVLQDVSLEIGPNEVVSVIGANGAGKTTLLRVIAGVIRPARGTIELFGDRTNGLPPHALTQAGVGHVPSGRELFPQLTVEDNLRLGAYGVDRQRRQELHEYVLELFPALRELLKRDAGQLSGGQQQMLAVSRALMSDPRLLLLDEPSTGLAPKVVASLFDALRRLISERNMSVLLVEQNVGLALSLARRGYVLETGQIVVSGEAEALKQDERVLAAYLG